MRDPEETCRQVDQITDSILKGLAENTQDLSIAMVSLVQAAVMMALYIKFPLDELQREIEEAFVEEEKYLKERNSHSSNSQSD